MFTIELSRITMSWAIPITARISQRRRSGDSVDATGELTGRTTVLGVAGGFDRDGDGGAPSVPTLCPRALSTSSRFPGPIGSRRAVGGARWPHGVHEARLDGSGRLADLPGRHELRRAGRGRL